MDCGAHLLQPWQPLKYFPHLLGSWGACQHPTSFLAACVPLKSEHYSAEGWGKREEERGREDSKLAPRLCHYRPKSSFV